MDPLDRNSFLQLPELRITRDQRIEIISWDQETVDHISDHLVSPEEVEEVLFNDVDTPPMMRGKKGRQISCLWKNSWGAAIIHRVGLKI